MRRPRPAATSGTVRSGAVGDAPLLEVRDLTTVYATPGGETWAVDSVSLSMARGEVLGILGESGCGKSTLAASLLRLVKPPGQVVSGTVLLDGQDIYSLGREDLRHLRGARLAYIPQGAMNALNPVIRVIDQVAEAITLHQPVSRREARKRAVGLLGMVGIPEARARAYPHELSGGMRQRVVIAMALANNPALVIADEPTTGLDVITQAEILTLMGDLRARLGLSMIFISHDLSAVLRMSDRLAVMYQGKFVEEGAAGVVATSPTHPYTRELLEAIPRLRRSKTGTGAFAGNAPGIISGPTPPDRRS